MKRADDFDIRRKHLAGLTDEQLKERFWQLAEAIVEPMLELGYRNTTPAIERSVLLRMGFSSLEAKPIVDGMIALNLMKFGAGNVVWRLSQQLCCSVREAGVALVEGRHWKEVEMMFDVERKEHYVREVAP